jgi:hypothetical protein
MAKDPLGGEKPGQTHPILIPSCLSSIPMYKFPLTPQLEYFPATFVPVWKDTNPNN